MGRKRRAQALEHLRSISSSTVGRGAEYRTNTMGNARLERAIWKGEENWTTKRFTGGEDWAGVGRKG